MGAISPGRWHWAQFSKRIGAMSLVNVTVDADISDGLSAATNSNEMSARPITTAKLLLNSLFISHPLFRFQSSRCYVADASAASAQFRKPIKRPIQKPTDR